MNSSELDELIDSSHFIDDPIKKKCKEYFKQIHKGLGPWFYSPSIPRNTYQGDIVDKLNVVYYEMENDTQEIGVLEDIPCMLLSHTCDMDFEGKTRGKHVSVAPVFAFDEFAKNRPQGYSTKGWQSFLEDLKANRITDILYIPEKKPLEASIILFDRIFSFNPLVLRDRADRNKTKRILSLSQIGFYFFLIKLTYHFARYEDRTEIRRG
jgi:hypothetical protein